MNLLKDHGKIPLETLIAAMEAARLNMTAAGICQKQSTKNLFRCLTKSVTSKVRENLNPYIKAIKQDGPLFFKYLMLEVASNPSSKAEARDI
jgi:hypothetical protein